MNKNEIIRKMEGTGFAPEEYWIQTGAALVMRGVRENTHDIDIGCTHALIEKLAARSCPYEDMPDGHRKYAVNGDIEASEEWGRGEVSLIDGIPVVSLEDVVRVKRELGRQKDFRDIERIRAFLEQQS
jgi:hypothetical protein